MSHLDLETEELLHEILESKKEFPQILMDKLKGLANIDDEQRLRAKMKALVDGGYITLKYAGVSPMFGEIEQKGRSYFVIKEQEETKRFNTWEKLLWRLLKCKTQCGDVVSVNFIQLTGDEEITLRKLKELGLIINYRRLGMEGVGFDFSYDGLHYFEGRQAVISDYYGGTPIINNNMNFYGDVSNSNIQQGTTSSNQATSIYPDVESIVAAIRKDIETYNLKPEEKEELLEMADDAEKAHKEKKPNKLKSILLGIGRFLKDVAVGVAAGVLAHQITY